MFFFHFFTALPCCLTLPYLWLFKTPPPDDRLCLHSQGLFLLPPPLLAARGWPFMCLMP